MLIIGERLTSGNLSVRAAIEARDAGVIADLAARQALAGADYLDIGAAALGPDHEPANLAWLVEIAQDGADIPLSLDCQNPPALQAAMSLCRRPAILNSFSGMAAEQKELLAVISVANPIAGVVAVCINAWGERRAPAERVVIAEKLAAELALAGVSEERIIFDPVTLPKSAGTEAEEATLATIELLRRRFPSSGILCAVSNYSYGQSVRRPANRAWARQALDAGATVFLCDPLDSKLMMCLNQDLPSPAERGRGQGWGA